MVTHRDRVADTAFVSHIDTVLRHPRITVGRCGTPSVRPMPASATDERTLVTLVFAVTLTSIMGNSLLAPAIPDVLEHFDRPDSSGGLLVAATSLPGIAVAPIVGLLADRHGRRRVLVPCLAIFGTAGIFAATAPTFELMLAARFVMGFGAAGLVNLAVVLIGDTFTGERRTYWIGKNAGVLTAALAVFPLASGFVTDVAGWRWALSPYGIGVVTAVVAWRVLPADEARTTATIGEQLSGVGDALRDRTILATFVGGGLGFAAVFGVVLAVLPTHLESEFGLGATWRGVVIGLPAVTSSLAAFNLARIRSRVRTGTLLMATTTAWMIAFAVIGVADVLWLLILGAFLYGAAEGAMIPSLQDLALAEAPDSQRAAVMATWTGFARLGQTSGPLLTGLVLAVSNTTAAILTGTVIAALMAANFTVSGIRRRP